MRSHFITKIGHVAVSGVAERLDRKESIRCDRVFACKHLQMLCHPPAHGLKDGIIFPRLTGL